MNIKEVEEKYNVSFDVPTSSTESKLIRKTDPIYPQLFEAYKNKELSWPGEKYHKDYYVDGHIIYCDRSLYQGNELKAIYPYYSNYECLVYKAEIRGITLWFSVDKEGEIFSLGFDYYASYEWSRYRKIEYPELNFLDIIIERVKKTKREKMTYYNKEIKRIKQEYKYCLEQLNAILKHE